MTGRPDWLPTTPQGEHDIMNAKIAAAREDVIQAVSILSTPHAVALLAVLLGQQIKATSPVGRRLMAMQIADAIEMGRS